MRKPDPHILVIFGASGDLTRRKLIPSLYRLAEQDLLPDQFAVIGVGRKSLTDQDFRKQMDDALKAYMEPADDGGTQNVLDKFIEQLYFVSLDTADPEAYDSLHSRLTELDQKHRTSGNVLYYLATPPHLYVPVARSLEKQGLTKRPGGWNRIIVEKPYGYDLESMRQLNHDMLQVFNEEQVYRIDHYLGKETVQNIMVTRFSNGIFEPLWNRNYISHVEITAAENIGVGDRGGYYEDSGALRDMFQNHMLQLVALVAMEPPVWADAQYIRNEMVKVLESIRPLNKEELQNDVVRAQYISSRIKGETVPGYREETGVPPDSRTETYMGMKFFIDNWRWKDVPFYVRTGKRLPTRVTEIVVHFQSTPHHIFCHMEGALAHNQLIIRIQPDEGLLLKFGMKIPGAGYNVQDVNMDFHYSTLSEVYLPQAYERLLHDCMLGDATLFARGDAVEAAWKFVNPILQHWKKNGDQALYGYPAGTWGPPEADKLFLDEGFSTWRFPCKNLSDDGNYCEL